MTEVAPAPKSSPVRTIISTYRARITAFAGLAFAGALLEAVLLVIVTGIAVGLTAGRDEIGPYLGMSFPMDRALVVGAIVLLVRLALNIASAVAAAITIDSPGLFSAATASGAGGVVGSSAQVSPEG